MYPNRSYYLKELMRARQRTQDDIGEGGPDYNHVIIDALNHLEGAVKEGFTPWTEYDGPSCCYRFAMRGVEAYVEIWGDSLEEALKAFRHEFPSREIIAVTQVFVEA